MIYKLYIMNPDFSLCLVQHVRGYKCNSIGGMPMAFDNFNKRGKID